MGEFEPGDVPELLHTRADQRRGRRHHAARGGSGQGFPRDEPFERGFGSAAQANAGGNIGALDEAALVRQAEMRVGVADVQKQYHDCAQFVRGLCNVSPGKESANRAPAFRAVCRLDEPAALRYLVIMFPEQTNNN